MWTFDVQQHGLIMNVTPLCLWCEKYLKTIFTIMSVVTSRRKRSQYGTWKHAKHDEGLITPNTVGTTRQHLRL